MDVFGGCVGQEPALRAAPVEQPFAGQVDGYRGGRHGQAPERCLGLEERALVLTQRFPKRHALCQRFAAEFGARGAHASLGTREAYI